jgi:hypothetical protein
MSYLEEKGRAAENSAPQSESNGLGCFDRSETIPSQSSEAPSFQFEPEELEPFRETGYELIPLHSPQDLDANGRKVGKAPLWGWRDVASLTLEEAKECLLNGANVGVRLRRRDLVIDVDPRNFADSDNPVARLEADLGFKLDDYPQVVTGSGGFHFYMTLPDDFAPMENVRAYPGIEFKSHGRQIVAPGSVHPDSLEAYRWEPLSVRLAAAGEAPRQLLDLICKPPCNAADAGEHTAEQLAVMLSGLNPTDYRDHGKWLELMMACHHGTAGEGREEFADWSARDPDFADHGELVRKRWDSLHTDDGGRRITVKTLYKALHDAKCGSLIPRGSAIDDFPEDGENGEVPNPRSGIEEEWVYVIDAEAFVRRSDGKKWSKEQWRAAHADRHDGEIVGAVFKGKVRVRKFESLVYLPCAGEFPDGEAGGRYNIWRDSAIEAKAGDVSIFLDHMANMIPDEVERSYSLDYLAMVVQNPARKVNYALLVRGAQGTGKSWIGRIMTAIIGSPNVVFPSNDEVLSNWTVWTEGSSLAVIEELMARGRLDMANWLKPIITEPTLRIEEKKRSIYTIPNHLNLIAFTNHEDALPIEAGDRRWLVISSAMKPMGETYYDRLFAFLNGEGPSAVKHYLLNRQVQLNPKGMAPNTKGKAEMRRRTLSEAEQHLSEALEGREGPFAFDLVRIIDLIGYVPNDLKRHTRNLNGKLTDWLKNEVGAFKHTRYTKGDDDDRPSWQLWSVREHEKWEVEGAAARVDAYMRHHARDVGHGEVDGC